MRKKLMMVGMVFMFIAVFLIAISFTNENVKAESASGTWVGSCTDQTGAANFYYTATLTLSGESSVYGTLELYCTDVYVKISGFEDSRNMIGTTTTATVQGTMSGSSSLTLYVYASGSTFTFYMTISGDKMTGGSQYTGAAGETNTWTFDLSSGGGFGGSFGFSDVGFFALPASIIAVTGGSASFAASFMPAPRGIRGYRNRPPVFRKPAPPFQAGHPQAVQPPPQQPAQQPQPQQPPLADPTQTLNLPIQEEIGPTNGNHPVPWDAPMQWPSGVDPPGYPYPKGTNAAMQCPFCHCNTLSPFTSGWYCTNPLCPARREKVQKGYTHHKFNNMTWRGSQL